MLINAIEMLEKAKKGKYAVAQINANNLEWLKAILTVSQETKTPVIVGFSEGAAKYFGGIGVTYDLTKSLIKNMNITVPVAIHLDHGPYELAKQALELGYTSVMFDGSHFSFKENIEKTKEIVSLAKLKKASVEAEVGTIGGEEDGVIGKGEIADIKECSEIAKTGITMLAAGIGNIHGEYPKNWPGLDLKQLEEIAKATNSIPLVLHGGSGIPDEQVKKAISLGVCKINVNSELQWAFAEATVKYCAEGKAEGKGKDPRKLLAPGFEAIKKVIKEKYQLFGSLGKA